jgi:hypothetical protein
MQGAAAHARVAAIRARECAGSLENRETGPGYQSNLVRVLVKPAGGISPERHRGISLRDAGNAGN